MTAYVCRDCRTAKRTALMGVDDGIACGSCGGGRVEVLDR